MPDPRTYIRVHDGMDEHPKIEGLSDAAFRLLFRSWFYCSRQLTDGNLTDAAWRNRGTPKARRELEQVLLVHRPGHDCSSCPQPPAGHVRMHDYLEHQRSAAEVETLRQKRSEAGRRGGRARVVAQADVRHLPKQVPEQVESKNEAVSVTEADPSLRSGTTPKRGTQAPARFEIDDDLRSWAAGKHLPADLLDRETERFLDHHRAKGSTFKDWRAAWRTWMSRTADFALAKAQPAADVPNIRRDIPPWDLQ